MSIPKFTPKPLPDDEIRLAQELCVEMGECSATYHIVIQLGEIERLCQINKEMYAALKGILGFFESGEFVRDTSRDFEQGWHIRMLPVVKSLSDANAVIARAEGRQ